MDDWILVKDLVYVYNSVPDHVVALAITAINPYTGIYINHITW